MAQNRRFPTTDGHGGVGIYINSDLSYCRRDDLSIFIPHVIETLFIEVQLNKTKSIILGVIYRPNSQPRADMDIFITKLADITAKINIENKESYIMGDFNIDLLKFQSHEKTKHFIESMLTTEYLPVITKPTRVTDHSATLLDHIYSNNKSLNYTSGIVITDVADHFGTFYVSRKKAHVTVSNIKYIRQMKAENFIHFKQILAATDFSPVLACDCPNEAYNKFICVYDNAFNIALPTKRIKLLRKYIKREPWMTQGLLNSSLNKSQLLRIKIKKPTENNIKKYKYFCKMFTKLKRLTKSKYYTDIFYMNISNVKRTWQILREVLNRQPNHNKQNELFVIGNSETNNKQDIANGFNTFFANIGKTINDKIIQPPEVYSDFLNGNYPINCFFQPTHEEEVIKVAQNLKTKTSQGFDNLSTCIIQKTMKEVAAPLTHIFNQSFLLGVVPDQMKIAKIVPVFKAGNKKILNNYRPISILPAFSKILEKLASIRLINFLESQDILYKHQYGFRQHYSTIHPILHLLNDISNANDNKSKDITLAIFLDMSKAFDTISHDILIRKLEHYGIRGTCKDWFASYLTNRFQYTEIHGEQSTYLNINTGVPQGSILGPILFLIYVNDIKNCSNLNILCFADDTTAYKSGPNIEDLITDVNIQLELLYTWLCCNKLSLNINKTSYTIFKPQSNAHHNLNNNLLINHEAIKSSEESTKAGTAKFLGIYIDKHLTWSQHIDQLCTSISKSVFAINRVKYILPYAALRSLYFSLIQSRLQYGIEAWGNSNSMHKLLRVQKRAIRVINNTKYRHHTDPLFKRNNIVKVSDLYQLQVFSFMYDLVNNKLPGSFDDFIPITNESNYVITTRQCNRLYMTRPRTTFSSNLPNHNFANIWNEFDQIYKKCQPKNKAKKLLRKQFINSYLNTVRCYNPMCDECNNNNN